MQNEMELSLLDLWLAIKKRISLILAMVIFFTGASFGISKILPKEYQSYTTMLLGLPEGYVTSSRDSGIRVDDIVLNQKLVGTYREYIKSRTVCEEVIKNLGLEMSYDTFKGKLDVGSLKDTEMITIKVTDTIPLRAKDIANETADIFRIKIAEALRIDNVQIVDYAIVSQRPIRPRVNLNTAIGGVLGLMLGTFLAILIELLDTTVKSVKDVEDSTNLSVFGVIPLEKKWKDQRKKKDDRFDYKFVLDDPKSPVAEAFRTLRTNLQFTNIDKEVRSIAVTSTRPREGKSTVAFNLAVTMAMAGKNVLLLDADLRKPRLHNFIDSPNTLGLTNILADGSDYIRVIQVARDYDNLHFITSGPIPPNPSELLSSKRMMSFLSSISSYYDMIIIDTPPMGSVTDSAILSTMVDGIILVAEAGGVKRDELLRSRDALYRVNANILGVVLNGHTKDDLAYGYYNYYTE